MRIDVWSDVVCPWCYIGKRRLEAALERFPHRDRVEVVYHSFELDPQAPRQSALSLYEMLARKYGMTRERAEEMQREVTRVAADDGLEFNLAGCVPENTFDAHRLLQFARSKGRQGALKEALLAAYFTAGKRVGSGETLLDAAVAAGLDAAEARAVLNDPAAHAAEVRADEARAREYGIRGVPFFVLDERYGVSGAQSAEALLASLSRAWSERPPAATAEGPACDDDGCALPSA